MRPQGWNHWDKINMRPALQALRSEPGEGRRPTLTWPRQIPIDGEPPDVVKIVAASADWLSTSRVPKLFFRAEPGAILANGEDLAFIRRLPALTEMTVAGRHYVQEDSPDEIGGLSPAGYSVGPTGGNQTKGDGHTFQPLRESGFAFMLIYETASIPAPRRTY